jgi:NAD+--asparagine ADP-ribosyltransferase
MKGEPVPQHPEIRSMLSPVIQKTATDEEVAAAAKKVEDFAAEHPDFRVQIGDIARRIIAAEKLGDYGTAKCQEYLSKWAKEYTKEVAEKSESRKD